MRLLTSLLFLMCSLGFARGASITTQATGGTNISADKASNATSPAWTTLGNIIISEAAKGDITANVTNGTVTFAAPSGWIFNAGVGSVSATTGDITSISIAVTSSNIVITYSTNNANKVDVITISGIQVQASNGATIPNSGNITISGLSTAISGLAVGNVAGSLSQVVGAAAKLGFTTQPSNGTAGSNLSTQPIVAVQDQFGSTITSATNAITLAIGTNPGGGTLTVTTNPVTASSGIATFSGVKIDKSGTGYTLTASATGLTNGTSSTFNITAGAAAKLAFTTQPGGGVSNVAWTTQPVVTLQDAYGNTVTGTSQNVTLAIQNNAGPGGILSGTVTVAVNTGTGLATFSGLSIDKPGTGYTLTATGSSVSTTPGTIVSSSFNIVSDYISTGTVSGSPFCAGTSGISVPFTYVTASHFPIGTTTFTAQLSDASGSFASPVTLQSVASNATGSQSVSVTIPSGTASGSGYRIRVISNSPAITGSDNGSNLTINALPTPTFTAQPGASACVGSDVTYTTQSGQSSYVWGVPGVLNTDYSITSGGIGSTSNTVTLKWLTAGSKTVTINYTNSSGCAASSATSSTATTINALPIVSVTGSTTICSGNTTTLSPTSGGTWASNSPAIASVTNGGVVTGLSAGSSTFTFTNTTTNCSNTTSSVTINAVPTMVLGLNPTICGGTTTANLPYISSTGSPDQYSIVWSGSPTGFSNVTNATLTASPIALTIPSNAPAATYNGTLTVRNSASGCSSISYSFSVTVIRVTLTPTTTQPSCYSDGGITLSASGGTSPYTYDWADLSGTNNPKDRTGLLPGSYSVTATDANGCTASSGTLTLNTPSCTGITVCKSDAAQVMSITPDPDNTSYTWTVPAGAIIVSGQGTPSVTINWTGVAVGSYHVDVVGNNSCGTSSVSSQPVYVTAPVASASADPACNGGNLQLYASGGVSYSWSGPNGFTSQSANPIKYNVSSSDNGTYTVTVTNSAGCAASANVSVTVNSAPTINSNTITNSVCGGSVGAISITQTGGTSFLWNTGATTQNISGIPSGNYTVTVTNASGCSTQQTFTVQNTGGPVVSITGSNVSCYGGSNGSISIASTSGGTSPYTYLWSNGSTSNTGISGLTAGTYSVEVTDNAGCKGTTSTTLTQPNALQADGVVTNVNCYGAATGSVNLTVSGGAAGYTYSWTGPSSFTAITQNISSRGAGTYNVTVTDNNSCTVNSSFAITQPSAALLATATVTNVNCNGGSDGQIALSVSGGTAPYTYSWAASGGGSVPAGQTNYQNLSGLVAGTYSVTVTDSKGCTFSLTGGTAVSVTQPAALSLSNTQVNVSCNGGSNGSINLTVNGGTAGYTYAWNNGSTTQNISGLSNGTYAVTVTDANGCSANTSVAITQPVVLSGTATPTAASCNGGSTGGVSLVVSGGTAGFTYLWSNAATTQNLTNVAAGFYSVTITDSKSCTTIATATVTEPAAISVSGSVTDVKCYGGSTGAITLSVSGGTAGYTYSWAASNGGAVPGGQATNQNLTSLVAGTYTVTVTDSHSCTKTSSFNVTQPAAALSLSTTKTDITCNGNHDGSINLTVNGGVSPYTYLWSNAATTQDISGLTNTTYSVTVTDANSCTANTSVSITQPAVLSGSATPTNALCNGAASGSISLSTSGGNGGNTYLWSNGSTSQNPSGLAAGSYTVTITDNKGCAATANATVGEPTAVSVTATASDVTCFGSSTGGITISASGGTPGYTYAWADGPATQNRANITTGSYTVTVTDAHSCTATTSAFVGTPTALSVSVNTVDRVCLTANGSAFAQVSGGTGPYTYLWSSGGATTNSITGLNTGTYSVTVTDANSCTANASGVVSSPSCLPPVANNDSYTTAYNTDIVNGTVASNDSDPEGGLLSFTAVTSPTAAQGTIDWDGSKNGTFTYTPTPGYTGTFSVTYRATDPSGLFTDATLTITVVALPTTAVNASEQNICITAGSGTLSGNTPTVGTGTWSVVSGPSTASSQFSNVSDPSATFTPAGGVGTYLVCWTISNPPNTPSAAYATITVNPVSVGGTATATASTMCNGGITSISLTGNTGTIQWQQSPNGSSGWADVTGGSGGTTSTYTTPALTNTIYYRAVVTSGGCASSNSSSASVNVYPVTAAPTGTASQLFCSASNPKVSDISVAGSNIIWYTAASGGSVVAGTTALVDGTTYYASQTLNGCESPTRLAVTVNVAASISAPTGSATQTFCNGTNPKVSDIVVTGSNIIWYTASSGGSVVAGSTSLVSGTTYYASQTIGGCESPTRLAVTVTVNPTPSAPTGLASQSFCSANNPKVSNISVTGTSVIWYDATTGGNVVAGSTALVNGTIYYATQTVTGCESTSRLAVTVAVNTTPSAPAGLASQTFCSASNPKVSDISGTGSNIIWYDAAVGGSVVAGSTALVNNTTYYASQTVSGCESTSRLAVTVTVNASISAPTGSATQSFCSAANPKVSDISVTGNNIIWYTASSGGSVVAGTTALVSGTTYYASQTIGGCESSSRLAVLVTVNTTPLAPAGTASQTFCSGANPTVSDIIVSGSNVIWYDAAVGGNVVSNSTSLLSGTTYYASQTVSGCESTSRLAVAVTVNTTPSAPSGLASQSFCSAANPKVSDISVTGSNIIWYNAASGGSVVAGTTALSSGTTYYASQTVSGCESTSRLAIAVTVNTTPSAPVGLASQTFCSAANPKISDISVTGSNIIWYNAAPGGSVVAGTTALVDGTTYYASQTVSGCESTSRLAVAVTVNTTPSTPSGLATQTFCSAANPNVSDISVTGSNIIWYNAASGGSVVTGTTALVDGTTYYASQTVSGCESTSRLAVVVTVNTTPSAPSGLASQSFCSAANPKVSDISVTGSNIIWYNAASGGSVVTGTTALVDGTTYYASQTTNGCESTSRLAVTVTVYTTPSAPAGLASQSFCSSANPKVSDISVTGSNIIWYNAASGGSVVAGNTALVDGTTYYASQTTNGCESTSRLAVTVTVHTTPAAPVGFPAQSFCSADNPIVSNIVITGSNIVWYNAAAGGSTVAGSTALADGTTYYASQTTNGCESASRQAVTVTVNPTPSAPTGTASQSFCSATTPRISDIVVTGSNIIWYDAASAGNVIAGTTALADGTTYYASQTTNGCESTSRLAVTVTVHTTPGAPIGTATQTFCSADNPKVSDILATGSNITWYDAASAGNVIAGTTALADGTTYYASQTTNGCESTSRLAVTVTVHTSPSAPTGSATQTFCSADNPTVSNILVTGSNIIWYDAATAGNIVAATNALADGTTYYTSQTTSGCESPARLAITVTVHTTPAAPTGSGTQNFCSSDNPKVSNIIVTGSGIIWYNAAVAGNVVAGTTALVDGTTYYASQTTNGCESAKRLAVTVNVNTTPSAPTGSAAQSFCNGNNPKVSDIVVTGTNIVWYDAASGGNIVAGTTALVNGTTYYASQTVNGCESTSRFAVTASILTCTGPNIINATVNIDENSANGTSVYDVNDNNTGNDKDVDGNNLTYTIISGNASGAFTIDPATGIITVADGSKLDYETTPTFVLVVRASNGTITDDATITINLNNLNDNAPVAVADSYSVNEGGTLNIPAPGVLANDYDADGNSLSAIKVTNPSHGTLTFNADGSFTYTHDGSETTSDAFTYKANDGKFDSDTVTVSITINPVNNPPVISNFGKTINEDNTLTFAASDFTGAYTDPENDPLAKIQITSLPLHGVLKLSGVPVNQLDEILATDLANLIFEPDANWNGSTSFTWNASDGSLYALSGASVNITVNAVNDPPVLSDINTSVNEDNTLTFSALDFTGAYSDVENDPLVKIKITSLPLHGTLKLGGVPVNLKDEILATNLGSLTFVPDPNWNGNTSFGWNAFDGTDYAVTPANVNITVNAVNDPPVVSDIYKGALTDATVTFTTTDFTGAYTDIENDPLAKIMIMNLPANGTLYLSGVPISAGDEIAAASLANITFVPGTGWNGTTSFAWNASDGSLYASASASVNITISATPNNPPVVSDITKSVGQNNTLTFTSADFTGAYTDVDSNPLVKIKITSLPANARLQLSGVDVTLNDEIPLASLGNLTLVPDTNWNGNTSFGWNGFDGTVYANTDASVNVSVVANHPPVVSTITKSVNEDNTLTFAASDFTGTYTDADNNPLVKIKITSLPANGTLMLSGITLNVGDEIPVASLGNLTFVPNAFWNGSTSFTWNGSDGTVYAAADDNVNITVNAVNDLPTLNDGNKTVNEDNTITFSKTDFTDLFTDVDGDMLIKIKITSLPANGTLMLNGIVVNLNDEIPVTELGNLTFVPNANWNGTTSFTWSGYDGTGYATTDAHINITVNAVNDAPILTNTALNQSIPKNNGATTIDIPANTVNTDGDILITSVVINPKHGTATIDSNGRLIYTPDANYVGNDTITYQVCDNGTPSLCSTGRVIITITPVNNPPALISPVINQTMINTGVAKTIDLQTNIVNTDGDVLTTTLGTQPKHGTAVINGSGQLIYTPNANFAGNDTITYQVCDNGTPSLCTTGIVVISITAPANHAPAIQDVSKTTVQEQPMSFNRSDFTSTFTDADNDTLVMIRIATLPSHGTLKLNGTDISANQEITWADLVKLEFVPEVGYYGETSFSWEASDGKDYSASATVSIAITQAEVFIPEGFSPNGDGVNDYFVIKGTDRYIVTVKIFNRWGNMVYESKHYQNDWDGICNSGLYLNNKLPDGTYYYIINFNNGEKEKVGFITINR